MNSPRQPSKGSTRILYVSTPWPYRAIRAFHVARALQQVGQVEIAIVDSEGIPYASIPELGRDFKVAGELKVEPRPNASWGRKLRAALDPRAPFPHGLGVTDEESRKLLRRCQDFDLIWFYKLRTANMFSTWQWPRSVVDVDDLPSGLYRTVLQASQSWRERLLTRFQILCWQRRERRLVERFSVLAVCSEADRECLRVRAPIHTIPNGFERPAELPARRPATPPRLGFIGLFDYFANLDGIRWFTAECWPRIKREMPAARLRLVGRGSDGPVGLAGPDIDGLGWVEDAAAEIASWSGMIVPLRIGGGVRVKIAEGFSRKCPVVATPLGAYGYEVQSGRELLLAEDSAAFASACVRLLQQPAEAAAMAERAYGAFLEKWTWEAIAPRVWAAAEAGLNRSDRQPAAGSGVSGASA